ncbi:hypothetical protein G7054_g1433 [Neopestalotiopsis clavispora]|nr:hypothetical protein G7054_g1433 [Neopestalotiopsis clavispora]
METPENIVRHAMVGFGARNQQLLKHSVIAFLSQRKLFNEYGLKLEFHIFSERDPPDDEEPPHVWDEAWSRVQDGVMRTGAPISAPLRGVENIPEDDLKELQALLDVERTVARVAQEDHPVLDLFYNRLHPAAYAMLHDAALPSNGVDVTQPFAARAVLGAVLRESMQGFVKYVEENVPEITINFYWDTQICQADVGDAVHPVIYGQLSTGRYNDEVHNREYDFVHNGQGMIRREYFNAERLGINHYVFGQQANGNLVRGFLYRNGLLTIQGLIPFRPRISPQAKIGIVGLGASAFDFVSIIARLTDFIETTPDGWRINETKARMWPGLITFITPDPTVRPPLHFRDSTNAFDMRWPEMSSLISTEELHALMLQEEFDWTTVALSLLIANVALMTGKDIDVIAGHHLSSDKSHSAPWVQMAEYHAQNEQYKAGNLTEMALLRTGQQLFTNGHGLEWQPGAADSALERKAPLTRRRGFAVRKSATYEPTRLPYVAKATDYNFYESWNLMERWRRSVPVPLHDLVAQLFDLGVACHQQASTDNFAASTTDKNVAVGDSTYDVIFAPPTKIERSRWQLDHHSHETITRQYEDEECAEWTKLFRDERGRRITPADEQPNLLKGRSWADDNNTPCHVFDTGPATLGSKRFLGGDPRIVGVRDADPDSLDTIFDWAPTAGKMLVGVSALIANGSLDPIADFVYPYSEGAEHSDKLHTAFKAETALFEPAWREVNEKHCFVKLIVEYHQKRIGAGAYLKYVYDAYEREQAVEQINRISPGARNRWTTLLREIPAYKPVGPVNFYLCRHLDFEAAEMDTLWANVIKDLSESEV